MYDKNLAIEPLTIITFIKSTQPKEWDRYKVIYGTGSEKAFIDRLCKEVRQIGIIQALRRGINDRGINFRLAG